MFGKPAFVAYLSVTETNTKKMSIMNTQINITKGSEKQIKWANSIAIEAIDYFDAKIEKMETRKPKVAKAYSERKQALINHPRANEAIFWIKNQDWMLGRNIDVKDFV